MNTSKTILTVMGAALCAVAEAAPVNWGTTDAQLTREGDLLAVNLTLDLKDAEVASDRAMIITPCLVHGTDTVALPAVGIYGRNRYYYYQRRSGHMISGADETVMKSSERPDTYTYALTLRYTPELNDSRLIVKATEYGCCAKPLGSSIEDTEASYREFRPWVIKPVYVSATAINEKTDSLADKAYINFVVNRTEINPDFRNNFAELGKIRSSIETVIGDPDCTITGIWLKGYASPEGTYEHNSKLAHGRTEALKEYIKNSYRFPAEIITTDYRPEDWDGLREYVAASNIEHRTEVLEIIDSIMEPDQKEALIKKKYPADYAFLLEQAYPQLRHTDYRIDYTIRRFTDIDEIRRVFELQPRKLDLNELYLLASTCTPGSEEFIKVYETAAKMFPADETANLNAASAALQAGNLKAAQEYLKRAGSSKEAQYTRGIYALLSEDYATAYTLLKAASADAVSGADDMLEQMEYNRIIK